MVNKKIKAIAKVERDAKNYFFVKMLYGFSDSSNEPLMVYGIEDEGLIDNLVALSYIALNMFPCGGRRECGNTIIIYDIITKYRYDGYYTDYTRPNNIIVGTTSMNNFEDINYLIRMISHTIEKEKMGEFFVQYKDKVMTEKEFYEFQDELSIYK